MKKEYDFSKGEKGKFYHDLKDMKVPVYLDEEIILFYNQLAKNKNTNISQLINNVLKKDIELYQTLSN